MIRRALWWAVVLAGLVIVWAMGLIDKGGEYPWERGDE